MTGTQLISSDSMVAVTANCCATLAGQLSAISAAALLQADDCTGPLDAGPSDLVVVIRRGIR